MKRLSVRERETDRSRHLLKQRSAQVYSLRRKLKGDAS